MNQKTKSFTEKWTKKPLPTEWENLAKDSRFYNLPLIDQRFLMLFYKQRGHCRLSYAEIGNLFSPEGKPLCKRQAIRVIKDMEEKGLIIKSPRFIGNTRIHSRNYIKLSKTGVKHLKTLLTEYYNQVFGSENDRVFPAVSPLPRVQSTIKICQEERATAPSEQTLQRRFQEEGFGMEYEQISKETILSLHKEKPSLVSRLLKFIRKKLMKGFNLKNFWGFFTSIFQLFKRNKKIPDFAHHEAVQLKEMINEDYNGDSPYVSEIIESVKALEKKTAQTLNEEQLAKLIRMRNRSSGKKRVVATEVEAVTKRIKKYVPKDFDTSCLSKNIYELRYAYSADYSSYKLSLFHCKESNRYYYMEKVVSHFIPKHVPTHPNYNLSYYHFQNSIKAVNHLSKVKPIKSLSGILTYCMNLSHNDLIDRFMKKTLHLPTNHEIFF